MPQLDFKVEGSEAVPYAVVPTIAFKLRISNQDVVSIHSIALRCQIQIESTRRRYSPDEQNELGELFGEPHRWGQTLRSMLWTQVNANVSSFKQETTIDLMVPCSFDFNVAATKYFASLQDGDVPLCLLFSGTIFYEGAEGRLQVEQIPWEKEANYRLPISIWRRMMDIYYPNEKWMSLRGDIFQRIAEYKRKRGLNTWEQTFESLLSCADEVDETPVFTDRAS